MSQVSYGTITITDTNDIERIYMQYCRSTSSSLNGGTDVPNQTVAWQDTTPAWVNGQYIWQRSVIEQSGTGIKTYGTPVCVTGAQGSTGTTGRGISSIATTYCNYGTGTPAASYSGWNTTVPVYDSANPNYWVKTVITYTSGTPATDTSIYKDNGITDATATAASANDTAKAAKETADKADKNAGDALDKANQVVNNVSILQARTKYFWKNLVAQTGYPVGTYAASGISGVTFDEEKSSTYGYNTRYANGIQLRYNAINLGELTGSALVFYHPSTSSQGAKAMELSASALKFFDATGTVAQAEFGGTQARISGTINAYDGQIGNNANNYWYIGNYIDYFQRDSAVIKSHGTAFIQLGDSSTWRVATNRIHTAWNDDSASGDNFRLHFPIYNSKYWDSGLHLPTATTDKFLYIRNAPTTQTLENLNVDLEDGGYDYWKYQFYISADGSLYARNLYVLDDYGNATQIGGTDGVYLLKSGGTITGNLEVNGTLTKGGKNVTYFSSTPTNGQIVVADGTGGGVKTVPSSAVFTDKNVQTAARGSTKTYLAGSSTTGTTTGTLLTDSTVYIETSNSKANLVTPLINGYALAAASAKGVDTSLTASSTSTNLPTTAAVANLIKGYLPLTGGQVTGPTTFGDSVSIDELTVGDLVVNGLASFTNNAQFNKINGVVVGTNPKFTDTVTTVTTTGTGNAITSASASNGVITFVKSATYLSGTGTNGYLAKWSGGSSLTNGPALGTATNTFLRNDGTWAVPAGTGVTSVAASGSGGITISGSPITTSGTIAIGLNLSTAINGLSEGTSPATRNDYLVAQYAGGGTTTTSYHRRSVANIFKALLASDIPNLSWTKITSDKPTTRAGYGITDAAGLNALVSLSATSNTAGVTTFTATRASGSDPISFEVSIIASSATGANKLQDSTGAINKGSATKPVYFKDGLPVEANTYAGGTAVTLNGTSAGASTASFYAPTGAGTSGQYLKSTGGAPTWETFSKSTVGLGNVDNTSDANKPVSNATQTALNTKQGIRVGNATYNPIAGLYVGSSGANAYARVKLPDAVKALWGMYFIEVSIRGDHSNGRGGKVLINGYHNSTSPYTWGGFNATVVGHLPNTVAVYGSDGQYIYIKFGTPYQTVSIDKILVGDTAQATDISSTSVDFVDALPTTYQTATMYFTENPTTVNGHTVDSNVPSGAKFTDTWNALSTSQAGYVSVAPNDTTKFLRGDATWTQVSSANLSDIALTWSGSITSTDWILAHDTGVTDKKLFRAMTPANLKTTMALNNVENKSSATIRSELTSANVTTALGYTPVNKAGDTMTGTLTTLGGQYTDSYSGALNMNNSNIYGLNSIYTADASESPGEGIHFYRDTTHVDTIYAASGNLYFVPNRPLGSNGTIYTVLHTGNYTTTLNNKYVTLDTAQTLTAAATKTFLGLQTFGSSGFALGVTSGTTVTQKANVKYDSSLDAIVFSFS